MKTIIKYIFILSCLILLSSCSKKEEHLKVTSIQDSTTYNFLNEVIPLEKDYLRMNILLNKTNSSHFNFVENRDVNLFFDRSDSIFALSQINDSSDFLLSNKYLTAIKVDSFNKKVMSFDIGEGKFEDIGYNWIRKPVFSADISKCLFAFGYYCGGTCGRDKKAFYRRENGKWVFSQTLSEGEY